MKNKYIMKYFLSFWVLFVFTVQFTFASEEIVTNDLKDVEIKTKALIKTYGAQNVYVIFDIDNTLLTAKQDLGTDQWFSWQVGLMKNDPKNPNCIAANFNDLLHITGLIHSMGRMEPTQKDTKDVINNIQNIKDGLNRVHVFALTSRGYIFQFMTLRDLLLNGITFKLSSAIPVEGVHGLWSPYDVKDVGQAYGFSKKEINEFKLDRKARDVSFVDGIYFVDGLHKGAMLRILFKKTGISPKAMVFVDDKENNTKGMQKAFINSKINLVTFRYSREDEKVEKFNKSDKQKAISGIRILLDAFDSKNVEKTNAAISEVLK